jgi:uncharacterized protein with HEPN domain
MRREEQYLADILEAADAIARFLKGISREDFLRDEVLQSAVLQKLIVIGEAAARLPKRFQEIHSDLEWADVIGFRNIAVHAYFSVNWSIVWNTATHDVPVLRTKIAEILGPGPSG